MRIRELALIKDIADQLRRRSGKELDDAEIEVLANVLLFLSVYAPMRDWLSRDIPEETVIRTVAIGAAAMVRELIGETGPR